MNGINRHTLPHTATYPEWPVMLVCETDLQYPTVVLCAKMSHSGLHSLCAKVILCVCVCDGASLSTVRGGRERSNRDPGCLQLSSLEFVDSDNQGFDISQRQETLHHGLCE